MSMFGSPKKHGILKRAAALLLAAVLVIGLFPLSASAASKKKYPTIYNGVNYAKVYSFKYYMKKYPSVKKKVGNNPKKALSYFVRKGMKKGQRASKSFDVKSYYRGNPALRRRYGKQYKLYYLHYINKGYKYPAYKKTATGVKKMVYEKVSKPTPVKKITSSSVTITSCKISGNNVILKATNNNLGTGTALQLFAVPSYATKVSVKSSKKTLKVSGKTISCSIPLNLGTSDSVLQKKFLFAAKNGDSWKNASNSFYIQNPQAAARITTAFPKPARGTKKGLKSQILSSEYRNKITELNCSHVAVDFPLEIFLDGSGLPYRYNGKTYYFSTAVLDFQEALRKICSKGIVVTGVFYLSDRNLTEYMPPEAARGSRSGRATFNVNTSNSNRLRLEALFSCLADKLCSNGSFVANWVFGNEINHYSLYNYSGDISYARYVKYNADAFRMFNTAVKSRVKNARTYFSFDHNWNLSFRLEGSYKGRTLLKSINAYLKKQGAIHWDIALHPYPSPELDPRFWNRSRLATDSGTPEQYTMLNMRKLSKWIKNIYGKSVHIILPETGISSYYQGREMESEQAAAVAYAYYLAEFDPNIDMIAIHREKSDPSEEAQGFHVSLYRSSFSNPKKSAKVFRYMDTKKYKTYASPYLKYINSASSWSSIVKGFSPARFPA